MMEGLFQESHIWSELWINQIESRADKDFEQRKNVSDTEEGMRLERYIIEDLLHLWTLFLKSLKDFKQARVHGQFCDFKEYLAAT